MDSTFLLLVVKGVMDETTMLTQYGASGLVICFSHTSIQNMDFVEIFN